jgi:hypothetical protein
VCCVLSFLAFFSEVLVFCFLGCGDFRSRCFCSLLLLGVFVLCVLEGVCFGLFFVFCLFSGLCVVVVVDWLLQAEKSGWVGLRWVRVLKGYWLMWMACKSLNSKCSDRVSEEYKNDFGIE